MDLGFVDEGVAATLPFQLLDAANAPVEPDGTVAYKIYGENGAVANGSGLLTSLESGAVTGATNASPIVITSAAHPVQTGQSVTVASVGGNTAANATWIATYVSANTFSLDNSTGNGAYTSGGTWRTTGLYKIALSGAVLNSLEAGKTYTVVVTWTEGGNPRCQAATFTVR